MSLGNYAVSVLPKLRMHKDCEVERLELYADEKEHIAEILSQDPKICVGRVKNMEFWDHAVFVFLKIKKVGEDPESLLLSIDGDELRRKIHKELKEENTVICIEKTEKLILKKHAVNILPALKTKGEMDMFVLDVKNEDQISEVLAEEYKGISFGGIKDFILLGSAVNLLPKIRIKEDCEVEKYSLVAEDERQVSNVLEKEDRSISAGRVKKMQLLFYAVCVITKLRIHEDNTMEKIILSADELCFSGILEEGDSSIEVGRIRLCNCCVPEKIRRKLRYTLVDGEASEVLYGEGNEVLEERSSSQRRNHLD
ncbi:MAG: uncharacterized protein A8A55_2029 [Amphiamblys sp. WSBS2006]|nr:MAG: uncharacterized protein A8A55_2029 [Amphiamblys sp. WSBS2006]